MNIPIHLAMSAISATLFDADDAPMMLRVSTDSRTIEPGDTFLALHGERFNGTEYVHEAVARGASMIIIDEPEARVAGVATMVVMRAAWAYLAMAGVARELFKGRVIGITGSAGKTTTKALLVQLLAARYGTRALAAPENENNEIGVSKLLLNASNDEHDVLVVEMGARKFGDIETLVTAARPEVGILTNIGDAHLEIFGSRQKLADTKWALFGRGARAVLNAGDAVSVERAHTLSQLPHWYLAKDEADQDVLPEGRLTALLGASRLIEITDADMDVMTIDARVPGAHNRANLAAALAGALELGVDLQAMLPLIPGLELPAGRFESLAMDGGRWRIIYDAYNANAGGTIAALDALADQNADRIIAVLGSMAELGEESVALHEQVGDRAAKRAHVVLVSGEFADALARGAQRGGMLPDAIVHVDGNAAAAQWLRENARGGDVVLLKGSRKYKLEEIVEDLQS